MSLQKYIFKGSYIFSEGKFYPIGDMETINKMRRDMKLLGDNGPCNYGFLLFNPQDGTYWHDIEQENYDTELKLVDRDYIEKNFPTVECDNLVDVDW